MARPSMKSIPSSAPAPGSVPASPAAPPPPPSSPSLRIRDLHARCSSCTIPTSDAYRAQVVHAVPLKNDQSRALNTRQLTPRQSPSSGILYIAYYSSTIKVALSGQNVYGLMCVFFTLNRSFYPSASSTPSVRADSSS